MERDKTNKSPLTAWFLGAKSENKERWKKSINNILSDYIYWRKNYFPEDPIILSENQKRANDYWFDNLNYELDSLLNKLKAHYPFYSPRYMAHMMSEQTLPSILGYFAGLLYNPNNVTDEAAPITVDLELEFGREIAKMLGFNPKKSWTHITSGGTVANIEALWVARMVQFHPLMIQEYCLKNNIDFKINNPNSTYKTDITKINCKTLISLNPDDYIYMTRKLINHINITSDKTKTEIQKDLNNFMVKSKYNINNKGYYSVIQNLKLKPVIMVSASAHYSIKKTANLLGYGEDSVRLIPIDKNFRMDIKELKKELMNLKEDEYVVCVIGVAGTTEEGSVDPIHKIKQIRDEFEKQHNMSFWIHIDAAWGGYIRTLFIDDKIKELSNYSIEDKIEYYINNLNITEEFMFKYYSDKVENNIANNKKSNYGPKTLKVKWDDNEVIKSFIAFEAADSITVDPHKLGYVPYPAGVIAFRNGLVTELIKQRAQYISDKDDKDIDDYEITKIGPYILEGSKPGASAASCWLAAKCIPLDINNHGKIIKTTLLSAKKLQQYLFEHKNLFERVDKELFGHKKCKYPFTFMPLYENCDTNVICFIVKPMRWKKDNLVTWYSSQENDKASYDINMLNELNRKLYNKLTIKNIKSKKIPPYSQDFFVSRTTIEHTQYSADSICSLFNHDKLNIDKTQYKEEGLFVLRSTIMNPWYHTSILGNEYKDQSFDYFYEFIKVLHKHSREIIEQFLIETELKKSNMELAATSEELNNYTFISLFSNTSKNSN